MKYRIFFDTEALWNGEKAPLNKPFSINIKEFVSFLKDNNVESELCIPDMVIAERIRQKIGYIEKYLERANEGISRLVEVGHKNKKIKPKKNYKSFFKKEVESFIKENNIRTVPVPKLSVDELVDRAVNKTKPFNDKTAGFKDSIIWLSIMDDARKKGDVEYILCTENHTDFTSEVVEEFKSKTKKIIHIVGNIEQLKELLDRVVPLGLELKKIHTQIEEEIKRRAGTLIVGVNQKFTKSEPDTNPFSTNYEVKWSIADPYTTLAPFGGSEEKDEIIGYDFEDIEIVNISKVNAALYTADVKLKTKIIRKSEGDQNPFLLGRKRLSLISHPDVEVFNVVVSYSPTDGGMYIVSMLKGVSYGW